LFAIDRGGLVGPDGPTHAGSYDLTYLRCLPNFTIMAPSDENEAAQMLSTGFALDGPAAVRYPRGSGPRARVERPYQRLPVGKAELRRRGREIAILAFGSMLTPALVAADTLDATVVNMRFVKPLDEEMILDLVRDHKLIVTVEENVVAGGAGSGVNEVLAARGVAIHVLNLGLPDRPLEQGSVAELLAECGLDAAGLGQQIRRALADGLVASRESA
ncbi:MAG: transketolase C-terminal domain-containing protein, partial [Acidiferrobacteraceae bacterium]